MRTVLWESDMDRVVIHFQEDGDQCRAIAEQKKTDAMGVATWNDASMMRDVIFARALIGIFAKSHTRVNQ